MIVTALTFLLICAVVALVVYGTYWVLGWIGCPETLRRILTVIVGLLCLLGGFTYYAGGGGFGAVRGF